MFSITSSVVCTAKIILISVLLVCGLEIATEVFAQNISYIDSVSVSPISFVICNDTSTTVDVNIVNRNEMGGIQIPLTFAGPLDLIVDTTIGNNGVTFEQLGNHPFWIIKFVEVDNKNKTIMLGFVGFFGSFPPSRGTLAKIHFRWGATPEPGLVNIDTTSITKGDSVSWSLEFVNVVGMSYIPQFTKGCVILQVSDHDVNPLHIISPIDSIALGSIAKPQAVVKNFGKYTETFPVVFQIGSFYIDTAIVNSLAPGDTQVISFTDWPAHPSGTHLPLCYTLLEGDYCFAFFDTISGYFIVTEAGPVPQIYSISPDFGGNTGSITVTIVGNHFREGATVRLTKNGEPDILADTAWTRVVDSTRIIVGFNLKNRSLGRWNVVVTNPDSGSGTFYEGFTIEPGNQHLWINITGRDLVRTGRPAEYIVSFGNVGNVDAYGVVLTISGIPANATVEKNFELSYPPQREGADSINWAELPFIFEDEKESTFVMPLFLPVIPANTSSNLWIRISVPTLLTYKLKASLSPPWFEIAGPSETGFGKLYSVATGSSDTDATECIAKVAEVAFEALLANIPGYDCVKFVKEVLAGGARRWAMSVEDPSLGPQHVSSFLQDFVNSIIAGADCANDFIPVLKGIEVLWNIYNASTMAQDVFEKCAPLLEKEAENEKPVEVRSSYDPNDKARPTGYSNSGYVVGNEVFQYMIYFENVDTAAFEAENIWITDTLDKDLDWNTFQFGEIFPGAGPDSIRPNFNATTNFDPVSGVITWTLSNINLPPDTVPYWGEGWVSYSIKPKAGIPTGTRIENIAAIKFDTNDWILAPMDSIPVLNIIDAEPPSSGVLALPDTIFDNQFNVTWSGKDDSLGSGIRSYWVYYSDNGGPFVEWLVDTSATSTQFIGQYDHTYSFYSIARDNVGHIEEAPITFDTKTTLKRGCGSLSGFVVADSTKGLLGVTVDISDSGGDLLMSLVTDDSGYFHIDSIPKGDYSAAVVTPLGYQADQETKELTVHNVPVTVDFSLTKLGVTPKPRTRAWWANQLQRALQNRPLDYTLSAFARFTGLISSHFNQNRLNPVDFYSVPQRATQLDSLNTLKQLLCLVPTGQDEPFVKRLGKGDLMALMLNVVSSKIHQIQIISKDSCSVSQAITYCDILLNDEIDPPNDGGPGCGEQFFRYLRADFILTLINLGLQVPKGLIPPDIIEIAYKLHHKEILPDEFTLKQNYPNPFNPETKINYALPVDCQVKLTVYNILGQKVTILVNEFQTAGFKTAHWDGEDDNGQECASGIYFYKIQAGEFTQAKKMVIVK